MRLLSIASICLGIAACSGRSSATSTIPSTMRNSNGTLYQAVATNGRIVTAAGLATQSSTLGSIAASTGPYRVHAFLEDTAGNMGCLYSANYAAVKREADIAESGLASKGRHSCPARFDNDRHKAGFKINAYNDVAIVGNGMPNSAISSGYYFKNHSCSAPFVQAAGGFTNGREATNLGHYPTQIAAAVNAWESKSDADYFVNDNFGNIEPEGIPVGELCPSEWSVSSYTNGFPSFFGALAKRQIVNSAGSYNDSYTNGIARSNVFMVSSEEGISNFRGNLNYSMSETEDKLNRLLQFQASGKNVALIQYNPAARNSSGQPIEFPSGFGNMYDQRMWNYAGGWLVLDLGHFYMQTANEGNVTNSGATVEPEYYFVPQSPLKSVSPGAVSSLRVGNLLIREYRTCYYKSKFIGACAMVLNPSSGSNSIPRLAQTYNHSVAISGEGAMPALGGVDGGVSTRADTGSLSYTASRITSVPAGHAVILVQ